jgi:hypothetical protein
MEVGLVLNVVVALLEFLALVGAAAVFVVSVVARRRYPQATPLLQLGLAGLMLGRLLPEIYNTSVRMGYGGPLVVIRGVVNVTSLLAAIAGTLLLAVALFVRRTSAIPTSRHTAAQKPPPQSGWNPAWGQQPHQLPPQPQQWQPHNPEQRR